MAIPRTAERMGEYIGPSSSRTTLPRIYQRGEITYEVQRVTRNNYSGLRHRALDFERLLDYGPFRTPREVISNVQPGVEIVFAGYTGRLRRIFGLPPKDVGVVTYEVKTVTVDGNQLKVQSTGVRAILDKFQKQGIGTDLAKDAIFRNRPDVLTGRTRHWGVIRISEKTGLVKEGGISPIDKPLSPEALKVLEQALPRSKFNEMDSTGLCKGVYPKVDKKYFTPPANNRAGMRIFNALERLGVTAGGVNGIRYYAEVDQTAVDDTYPEYQRLLTPELLRPSRRPFIKAIAEKIANLLQV